jgi:dTMP kinase
MCIRDRVILLDLPVEEGLRRNTRKAQALDRIGGEDVAFHRRVRGGYLSLSREDPRIRVVAANQDADRVERSIWEEVRPLVEGRGGTVG